MPPLPPDTVRALTESVAAGVDPSPVVATSNGNPLLVVEMARALAWGEDVLSDQCLSVFAYAEAEALSNSAAVMQPTWAPTTAFRSRSAPAALPAPQPGDLARDLAKLCAAAQRHGRESDFAKALHLLACTP